MVEKIRTRFAPSPTGYLHIGGLRTALFEYAYAKTHGGEFILRIEDTDRKRFVPGATEKLISILRVFGIEHDEGPGVEGPYTPYIQSQRVKSGLYEDWAKELIAKGHAYYCFCRGISKGKIDKLHKEKIVNLRDKCRNLSKDEVSKRLSEGKKPAIRLRVPDTGSISYHDFILEREISWELADVDEAMLLKSDGYPTYHLAVVVDDILMDINPILRGFEWIPSTPIHLLLYKYFGKKPPKIGHFSLILDPEGGKLSKRKGNVSCEDFLTQGFLPEAILNFVMLLGWAPKNNREMFNLPEYVKEFKNGSFQIANAVFNRDKLDWFNGEYIRKTQDSKLRNQIYNFYKGKYNKALLDKIIPLVKERIVKLSDFESLAGFFYKAPKVDDKLLTGDWKKHLESALKAIEKVDDWKLENINESFMDLIKKEGFKTGEFFMSLRIVITGSKFTPPINESIEILGRKETIARLSKVLKK